MQRLINSGNRVFSKKMLNYQDILLTKNKVQYWDGFGEKGNQNVYI